MIHSQCTGALSLPVLAAAPPSLVLSYIDLGPKILFDTVHSVLGAPYHRDNHGLRATIELFRSEDDAWIARTLKDRSIAWIATCPGVEERTAFKTDDGSGLAERLAKGEVPGYLEEVVEPTQPAMRLYRVRPGS